MLGMRVGARRSREVKRQDVPRCLQSFFISSRKRVDRLQFATAMRYVSLHFALDRAQC